MKLTSLGINKHVLEIKDKQALFSNGVLVAVYIENNLYIEADRSRLLPNTIRHIQEWAQSLKIPPEFQISYNNIENLL